MAAEVDDGDEHLLDTIFRESFPGKNDWICAYTVSKPYPTLCFYFLLESWRDNPDFAAYLTELSSSTIDRLGKVFIRWEVVFVANYLKLA